MSTGQLKGWINNEDKMTDNRKEVRGILLYKPEQLLSSVMTPSMSWIYRIGQITQ